MTEIQMQNLAFTLPADPDAALEHMILTIQQLKDVYIRETEALENAKSAEFLALQDEKFLVAQNYQGGIQQIMARQDEIRTGSVLLKNTLRKLQVEFSTLLERNLEALKRMNKTALRLGEKIRSAAMTEANKYRTLSYGETGHVQHDGRKMVSAGIIETA